MDTSNGLPPSSLAPTSAAGGRIRRLIAPVLLVVIVAVSGAVAVAYLAGVRWFMVETPSMGVVAPVGTLVITQPVRLEQVQIGQVIAFRPPSEVTRVYTHRVVAIEHGLLRTRGDINGAADGWRLGQHDLIGSAIALLPGVGFLLRAVPVLLAGNAVLWLASRWIRNLTVRAAVRTIGFGAVASLPSFLLHPFIRIQVLTTQPASDHITAAIVSTGLLPVQVTAGTGTAVALHDGQVRTLALPTAETGYQLHATIDLTVWGWIGLVTVCLLPLAWSLIVGLPAEPDSEDPDDGEAALETSASATPADADTERVVPAQ